MKKFIIIFLIFLAVAAAAYFVLSPPEDVLYEASSPKKSADPDWWLNSGGKAVIKENLIETNQGELSVFSFWKKLYQKQNSLDTDDGYRPQNIFRLVRLEKCGDCRQTVYFKIRQINFSRSKNRNESNGVLIFNRYQDESSLYYAGLRTDGYAVIKKKIDGDYFTLAEKDILAAGRKYDRKKNTNFLPLDRWIGIRSEIRNTEDEAVSLKFYVDMGGQEDWKLVLEIEDDENDDKDPLLKSGYGGLRSDFMDVSFRDYAMEEIE